MSTCIVLVAGQSYADPFTFRDPSAAIVNLTGCTATMVFSDPAWGTPLLSLSSAGGTLTMGGVLGTITPTITGAQTTALGRPMRANVTTVVTFVDLSTLTFYDTAVMT